jgi:hypothetical protein
MKNGGNQFIMTEMMEVCLGKNIIRKLLKFIKLRELHPRQFYQIVLNPLARAGMFFICNKFKVNICINKDCKGSRLK